MRATKKEDIEGIELELFLDALYQRHGYDFRHYARASVRRRVRRFLEKSGCARISEMIPRVLYDEAFSQSAIYDFSITVTEMFRDPTFIVLSEKASCPICKLIPLSRSGTRVARRGKRHILWLSCCKKKACTIGPLFLPLTLMRQFWKKAKEGIYPLKDIRQYTLNYQKAGGMRSFAEYYLAQYESAIMPPSLKSNITFASHNLVTDGVFGELHMIFCRNVLIYFDKTLQNRVLNLFADSLSLAASLPGEQRVASILGCGRPIQSH